VRSPLHGVVDFSELQLWRRLSGVLVHLPLGVDVDRAVFSVMVGIITMVHAVQVSQCVWASVPPTTSVGSSTSLAALGKSLVKSSRV
jgi:hypothetical protein